MRQLLRAVITVAIVLSAADRVAALDLTEVVQRVEPSVVLIDTGAGLGSGVVVKKGWVITNHHVVAKARQARVVTRGGKDYKVQGFLAADPGHDMAVLKIDERANLPILSVAKSMPKVGEKVATCGMPKGLAFSVSDGIVSAIRTGKEFGAGSAYGHLGYSPDSTWIQTTAAISGGNSGGPLVNMNAEIVGLNTWSRTDGQNLNFAISMLDIERVLKECSNAPLRDFDALPKRPDPPQSIAGGSQIKFPSGRAFSFDLFDAKVIKSGAIRPAGSQPVAIKHDNGVLYALAHERDGKLHGPTFANSQTGEILTFAMYEDGKRHGTVQVFNESGEPVLFGQYSKGKPNGFLCFLSELPSWVVVEYKMGQPTWYQLMLNDTVVTGSKTREEADKHKEFKEILAKFDEAQASILKNEAAFKKQIAAFEERKRRALAAAKTPDRRARSAQETAERNAAETNFIRQMERMHGLR